MRNFLSLGLTLVIVFGANSRATSITTDRGLAAPVDSDHDGLSDDLEQSLLDQFLPKFMVSEHDCSNTPAEFAAGSRNPIVHAENGTIYGQVFPTKSANATNPVAEIHYYHLWQKDCGRLGHALDTEHVSVLIRPKDAGDLSNWTAIYWYAAAHEDTVCDASQISRAATLRAEDRGATVWISAGKHASFLNEELCQRGCGGDICLKMSPLSVGKIVNLGESGVPMNGAMWTSSPRWPLTTKMVRTDFQPAAVARLEQLSASDIAWVNPEKRPAQVTIAAGGSTVDALAISNKNTDSALSTAGDATGNAMQKSYRNVERSLGASARGVGRFLRHQPNPNQ